MYVSQITHWSTLAYCKILYVDNLILEKTKSLSRTCNEKTNTYNITTMSSFIWIIIKWISNRYFQSQNLMVIHYKNTNKNAKQNLLTRIQNQGRGHHTVPYRTNQYVQYQYMHQYRNSNISFWFKYTPISSVSASFERIGLYKKKLFFFFGSFQIFLRAKW